jgi:hypothetical protein
MAGEYGVNIKFRAIGLSQLDKAKAKAKELENSVSKIRSLDLGKAIRGPVGDQIAEATGQIRRYAKQVNETGKVVGNTRKQQMAALESFEMMRDEVQIGSVMFNEMSEAVANQTRLMNQNTTATNKNASARKKQKMFPGMSQGFLGNLQQGGALQSGLVSGAFPLLFGQGPLGGAAGFAGGFLGTKMGGQMGGFAGGLVATAVLQQLTTAIQGLNELGKALDPKNLDIDTVSKSFGLLGTDTQRYLKLVEQTQGKQAAYNAVIDETSKLVGEDGVRALKAFGDQSQNLTNEMSKFFTRLGADIAKLFTQSAGDDDLSRPILGFERSNLLAEAKNVTDNQEIMDLVKQRQNANKNVARQLDNQIAKLMKAKKIEDARKKAAELARMEYEMITKSLTDQISFLENAITLGNAEAEIIKEKNRLIEAAKKAGVEFDEAEIERQIRLKRELEKLNTLYQGIASSIETGIVDALEGAINGTKTLGDVARSVFGSIQRQLLDFGVNALLSSIPGFGNFFKRANGGPVSAGQSYMVGERGPEMFVPNAGGRIVSNEKTGAGTTNIVVNVDASGSSVQGDEEQGRELGRLISVAVQSEILQQKRPGGLLA